MPSINPEVHSEPEKLDFTGAFTGVIKGVERDGTNMLIPIHSEYGVHTVYIGCTLSGDINQSKHDFLHKLVKRICEASHVPSSEFWQTKPQPPFNFEWDQLNDKEVYFELGWSKPTQKYESRPQLKRIKHLSYAEGKKLGPDNVPPRLPKAAKTKTSSAEDVPF